MKNPLLFVLVMLSSINVYSQNLVAPPGKYDDNNSVFTKVDKEAAFPGGLNGWKKYIERNLNTKLAVEHIKLKRKQLVAQQSVTVKFTVSPEGKISNVEALNYPQLALVHPSLIQEAIRVIKEGPDWIPAEHNGKKVNYQAVQSIVYQVAK